jgi:LuxR family maltose regulon positive regulatory protein
MYQQHSKINKPDDDGQEFIRPDIVILDELHWSYIQRRYRLSPRETQVAKLVCQGLVNEEIAQHLKITNGTVKTHLRNVYRRIRVRNKITMLLKFITDVAITTSKPDSRLSIPVIEIHQQRKQLD